MADDGWAAQVAQLLGGGGGREAAAAVLRDQVAAGAERVALLAELEAMRGTLGGDAAAEDALQELMDRLAGWCEPGARI